MINLKFENQITIDRFENGVPKIIASTSKDELFALGYIHAIDRGMQLLLMRTLGQGRTSEYLDNSDDMLEIDKFFRKMNWSNNINKELSKFTEEETDLLNSYCKGIEAGFKKKKPFEFNYLFKYKNYSWTIKDSILIARMMGYLTLAQSQGEVELLFIQMVQNGVSKELLIELFPNILDEYDEDIIKQINLNEKVIPDAVKFNVISAPLMASNNWVVSGNKTKSGLPLLANDPHLEVNRIPGIWYEVDINNKLHGATMPGIPAIIIGRNEHLSWGVTYAFMDAADFWIEEVKDQQYKYENDWHNFTLRKEVIKRKKKPDEIVTFYENQHGVLDGTPNNGFQLTYNWSGNSSGAATLKCGLQISKAQSSEEGMKIIGLNESAFSWVFADTKGNIGYQMSGLYPIRENWKGFTPGLGWKKEYNWKGYEIPENLPREINPERGYIVTANNNLNHLGKTSVITMPMGEYRAKRISNLIEESFNYSIEDAKKMHYDCYSLQAEVFMPIISPLLPEHKYSEILKNWDLNYDLNSEGAYLFEQIYRAFYHIVFGETIGSELVKYLQNETGMFIDFYANFDQILLKKESKWFGNKTQVSIFKEAIAITFEQPLKKWGEINQIKLNNVIFGNKLPTFFGFDKGPKGLKGGRATIHQGQVYQSAGRKTSFAPSYRIITDLSKPIVYSNNIPGVSDRRWSKYYFNLYEDWEKGYYNKYSLNFD